MLRNFKSTTVGVLAVLMISGWVVSAAFAQEATVTSDGPVSLDGTETGVNAISAFGGVTTCVGSTTTVFKYDVTPHTPSPMFFRYMTLIKHRTNCKIVEGGSTHKATVTPNGCDEVHKIDKSGSSYVLTKYVVCPAGKAIEIEVYPFVGSELGGVVCTIKIGSQSGLTGASIANGAGDLVASGTFTGLKAEKSGSACATETTTSGTMETAETMSGTNEAGGSTAVLATG